MRDNYYENEGISNSLLGWMMVSPKYFKAAWEGKLKTEESRPMELGSIIHKLVLQPDSFNEDYSIADTEGPKSANQDLFCTGVSKLDKTLISYDSQVLELYSNTYYFIGSG